MHVICRIRYTQRAGEGTARENPSTNPRWTRPSAAGAFILKPLHEELESRTSAAFRSDAAEDALVIVVAVALSIACIVIAGTLGHVWRAFL
jgi:hypothetical protein